MKNSYRIQMKFDELKPEEVDSVRQKFMYIDDHPPLEDRGRDDSVFRSKLHNEKANDLIANRGLRDKYSFKAFKVVKKSLWGWAILLFVYGVTKFLTRHENNGGFEIFSDHVLIAITTATSLNIFAAFLSLIRGLFPSIQEDKIEK